MRPDGKGVVIGKRISAVCTKNTAASGLAGQLLFVTFGGFLQ